MSEQQMVQLKMEGPVAILTLNRAKQLNALNRQVLTELKEHLDALQTQKDVRTVLVTGDGRAFAAGADISQMNNLTPNEAQEFAQFGQSVFSQLEALPQPTIALVQGYALGGGMELAMACDVRIAAQGAKFGQPEVTLGILPGFGGSQRLPRIVGQGRALHIMLSGEMIDAEQALSYGLVTAVVPPEQLLSAGFEYADKLHKLGPVALQMVKRAVYEGAETDIQRGLALEAALFGSCFTTADREEGMTAFLERRKPSFTGR
ncbi:enoyl-CoA hydratase/isomerase family protein [Alicyclobacillus tolerans]|uniref:enoyl-CoA hydratase/isomerase family protein n=1 Tax=Alicyclobacillus tolerans TaxID=90970 RepID=UPI001F00625C|nr:enoyl-CoA hydratase-related protein [Alicyclobacillus tolerans]MCF8565632.1 enoyl-CoA hydratase/isomerase family protein [Alicyclobacillus tolerans]